MKNKERIVLSSSRMSNQSHGGIWRSSWQRVFVLAVPLAAGCQGTVTLLTQTGACCVDNTGICTGNVPQGICESAGNRYGGNGSTCGNINPPCVPLVPEVGVTDVAMQDIAFVPKEVTIRVGERVRWTNLETLPIVHTTTSGSPGAPDGLWTSGDLSPGDTPFVRQFDQAGEFIYFCEHHPNVAAMRDAKVIVQP